MRAGVTALIPVLLLVSLVTWASPSAEKSGAASGSSSQGGTMAQPSAATLSAIASALGSTDLPSFLAEMDADRLLLAEIRKDLPQKRDEADAYMKRLKELAGKADPADLVPKVNRMMEQAPTYYDYLEKNIQNQNDAQNEYAVGGARGFLIAFQDLQNAVLLTVINRLEIAEHALRNAAGISPG